MKIFTVPLSFKNYLIGSLVRQFTNEGKKILISLILICNILIIGFGGGLYLLAFSLFGLFFVVLIMPLLTFLYAKFYLHGTYVNYSFSDTEIGYAVMTHRASVNKTNIKSINVYSFFIKINLMRGNFFIIGDKKIISDINDYLQTSPYKSLIK